MFRRLHDTPAMVTLTVNGVRIGAAAGDTVAAALLLGGHQVFRRTVRSGEARGPYCAMGTCFECLVMIDGQPSMQACLVQVRDRMVIETTKDTA
jgi:D-hydroxyproline dehydrogenase subunit gamma